MDSSSRRLRACAVAIAMFALPAAAHAASAPAIAASGHPLRRLSGYVQLGWASYVYAVSRRAGELALSDVIFASTGYVSGSVKRLYTVR